MKKSTDTSRNYRFEVELTEANAQEVTDKLQTIECKYIEYTDQVKGNKTYRIGLITFKHTKYVNPIKDYISNEVLVEKTKSVHPQTLLFNPLYSKGQRPYSRPNGRKPNKRKVKQLYEDDTHMYYNKDTTEWQELECEKEQCLFCHPELIHPKYRKE